MNYSVLPPEILSGQIHSGPGPAPLLAAATSWTGLADELSSAAAGFSSITSQLAGSAWQGPASAAMAAAASPYASWLGAAASQAAGAATQANAVAALQDTARAVMVHPLAVAANRAQLVALVRSNLFGFAAPAIAATESAYEEMWATDVGAMAAYHGGASAAAAQLAPWQQLAGSLPGLGSSASAAQPAASGISGWVASAQQAIAQEEQAAAKELQDVRQVTGTLIQQELNYMAQVRQQFEQILGLQQPAPPPAPKNVM
jgi:PPE-repeat protein